MSWPAGFGQSGTVFGEQQQQTPRGTRQVPFHRTQETEQAGLAAGFGISNPGFFQSISAMPVYQSQSPEELRFEDYLVSVLAAGTPQACRAGLKVRMQGLEDERALGTACRLCNI